MSGVTDTDRGYARILKDLASLNGADVFVGIRQEKGQVMDEDGDITVAGYATVNEFGSEDGRIPERSFLRSTVDEKEEKYQTLLAAQIGEVLDGKQTPDKALMTLGERAVRDVQMKIASNIGPANAESTYRKIRAPQARRKGGATPKGSGPKVTLIDTGRMRQSIDYEIHVDGKTIEQPTKGAA
jgi:hypothetical protein